MNFITVTAEQLNNLRESLEIIEQIQTGAEKLYFYGSTSDTGVTDAVKEAIAGEIDEEETDVKLSGAVAVCVELSSDVLHYLTGSGLKLTTEDVAYSKGGGTGINTVSLVFAQWHPKVTSGTFDTMALAGDDMYLYNFLQRYGAKTTAPATATHPHTEVTREGVKEHAPGPGEAKTTSSAINRASGKPMPGNVDPQLIKEFLD
jgi:hypothetical protein